MGGVIDEAIVRLVRSDECGRTRQPPIHMATPAPKIGNIPRKIVIPNDVGDKIHVHASAEFARRYFPAVKAVNLGPVSDRKRISCQNNIGIAPDKVVARAAPPGMPENLRQFRHFGTRREERRFEAKGLDALEQPLLSHAQPLVRTGFDPLEGDAELHTGLQHKPPTGRPAIARPPFVNCFWHPSTGPRCIVRQSQDWRNFLRRGLPNRNFWANAFRNNRQGMLARIRNRLLNEFTFQSC